MKKLLLWLPVLAVIITACVPSVNPFYTEKDVVTDLRFAGTWTSPENESDHVTWKFEASTNNTYSVLLTEDKGKTGKFDGHLFKLDGNFYLDLTPTECEFATNQASIVGMCVIPGHLLLQVVLEDKKLGLAFCNPEWIKKFLEKNPKAISHRIVDDSVILTADTPALQKFVLKHLAKDEMFGEIGFYDKQP